MAKFCVKDKVVLITGGSGVLGSEMGICLAESGAKIVILSNDSKAGEAKVEEFKERSLEAIFIEVDVLNRESLTAARDIVVDKYGKIDVLINAAGGNMGGATISPEQTLFDMDIEAFTKVLSLNLTGTVLPTMIFGEVMAKQGTGSIINISSMSSQSVITRVVGYSASKAAIDNFTRWTSVEMAKKFGEGVRVNAIAPGFFLTEQNRTLLTNSDGSYTERAEDIVRNTPFGRMGKPSELTGAIQWLASDDSSFVTGAVIPIDGGFNIFSGV